MSQPAETRMGVSDVRANMTEVLAEVRLLGRPVVLTRREKAQAVLVSVADYEQTKTLRKLADLLKAHDADLYEDLLAKTVAKRTVRVRRPKPDEDVL